MPLMTRNEIRALAEKKSEPCVSIFAPMAQAGADTRQNPIRFKNLVREAEEKLIAGGMRAPKARELLAPLRKKLDDSDYWQYQSAGLAFFHSPSLSREYHVPLSFKELAVVDDIFFIKPLTPLMIDGRYFILALSKNEVRFFQATRDQISEVDVRELPKNLADALKYDVYEKSVQWHTQTPGPGRRPAMFHGISFDEEIEKKNVLRYFRQIDEALHNVLRETHAPLVLAGVEYFLPIYREANTYPLLEEEIAAGNPDSLRKSPEELHRETWAIIEKRFKQSQDQAVELYGEASGTPRGSKRLVEVLPAAHDGRVAMLLVADGVEHWGRFDPRTHVTQVHTEPQPGDEDLLNLAVVHTYLNSGKVYTLAPEQMPDGSPLAAVLRY